MDDRRGFKKRGSYSSMVGRRQSRLKAKEEGTSWWERAVRNHPFKALTSIGGLLLLVFFAHLGELPEIDLTSSASVLAAVALIGLLVATVFGGISSAAGLLFINAGEDAAWLRTKTSLLLAAIPGLSMVSMIIVQIGLNPTFLSNPIVVGATLALCVVVGGCGVIFLVRKGELARGPGLLWQATMLAGCSGLWAMTMLMGQICLIKMLPGQSSQLEIFSATAAWGLYSAVVTLGVATSKPTKQLRVFLGTAALGFLMLVTLTSNYSGVSVAAVRAIGLGNVPVRLVLTEKGCQIINGASLVQVCKFGEAEGVGIVCPVILESKIGSPFLVRLSAFDVGGAWPARELPPLIPLPSSEVLSWPRISALQAGEKTNAKSGPGSATKPVVSFRQRGAIDKRQSEWLDRQCGATPQAAISADSKKVEPQSVPAAAGR